MAKQDLINFPLPSSPEDIQKIQSVIKEIVNSKFRAQGEAEYQREAVAALAEDFDIPKQLINRMVKDTFKDTFDEGCDKQEAYETLYEKVMLNNNTVSGSIAEGEVAQDTEDSVADSPAPSIFDQQ